MTEQELALHSKTGRQIENVVAPDPEPRHVKKYDVYRAKHRDWINRKPSCGRYNCYGQVFAARRTAIYPDEVVEQIRLEDRYRVISLAECVVGDVVIYQSENGFVHAAQIVKIDSVGALSGALRQITLLSKWDDTAGEDLHLVNDVPFSFDSLEVWTER